MNYEPDKANDCHQAEWHPTPAEAAIINPSFEGCTCIERVVSTASLVDETIDDDEEDDVDIDTSRIRDDTGPVEFAVAKVVTDSRVGTC